MVPKHCDVYSGKKGSKTQIGKGAKNPLKIKNSTFP